MTYSRDANNLRLLHPHASISKLYRHRRFACADVECSVFSRDYHATWGSQLMWDVGPMNIFRKNIRPTTFNFVAMMFAITVFGNRILAEQVEGFTQPYRTINVAAVEVGIITAIDVREGDVVSRGQILATLDQEVLEARKVPCT